MKSKLICLWIYNLIDKIIIFVVNPNNDTICIVKVELDKVTKKICCVECVILYDSINYIFKICLSLIWVIPFSLIIIDKILV